MLNRRLDLWLPTYLLDAPARFLGNLRRRHKLTHIMFLVCDHFEPRFWIKRTNQPAERLREWQSGYAKFQKDCRTQLGIKPVHTWFYPPHHGAEHLPSLANMVFDGLGEVELHYHHSDDTPETLRRDLSAALTEYHRWGLLLESGEKPRTAFGFVHGDWALDNSFGGKLCGVNGELAILQQLGCWGDFTMPSGGLCQTRKINSIYYAVSSPHRSKSHNWGSNAQVGRPDPPGLFLMQGPLGINWQAPGYPHIENASLTSANWGRPDRIRKWLDCQVQVKGRPDWLFVKLHTHGAWEGDWDALFGEKAFEMLRVLSQQYNDGERYRLHYVTARQAYNIAKAAEHGKEGSPTDWLDYVIRPQANSIYFVNAPHELKRCTTERLEIASIESNPASATDVRMRVGPIRRIVGPLRAIDVDDAAGTLHVEGTGEQSEVMLYLTKGASFEAPDEVVPVEMPGPLDSRVLRLNVGQRCTFKYRSANTHWRT